MNLGGTLRVRRVVTDLGGTLDDALDWGVTGYLRVESEGLLRDVGGATVLTLDRGVPAAAATTGGERVGADALAQAGADGLSRLELRELDGGSFPGFHNRDEARIPPTLPAKQLVGDSDLVERTREAAPDGRVDPGEGSGGLDAVESFLDDADAIASIRDRARTQARQRADEWGFDTANPDERPGR